jgi:5-methylcytosine-specific restriction protein A
LWAFKGSAHLSKFSNQLTWSQIFIKDQVYKRSELHDSYGGNRQSGISPSQKSDVIFLFTGDTGKEYGYEDCWKSSTIFNYTGEGQVGDMKFERGNKSIRDHISNGKSMYLFEQLGNGLVRFLSEVKYIDYHQKEGLDRNNNPSLTVFTLC